MFFLLYFFVLFVLCFAFLFLLKFALVIVPGVIIIAIIWLLIRLFRRKR